MINTQAVAIRSSRSEKSIYSKTKPHVLIRCKFTPIPLKVFCKGDLEADIMQADILSPESLKRIFNGVDTVIQLCARAAFEPYPRLYPSIVKGSINLMQAAVTAGVKKFIYGGRLFVYGDNTRPIERQTEAAPESGYGIRAGKA